MHAPNLLSSSMALSSNLVSFLFFTILLLSSLQIQARDSQFFSKVTHPVIDKNNGEETELPNEKEEPVMMNKPDQQEPVFIPEIDNNYGLYGHESAGPTTTTTTYQPYKTESEEEYMRKYPNKYSYYNRDQNDFINNNNNNYYKDAYGNDLDKKRYTGGGYENMSSNQMRKNQKLYNGNNGGYDHRYRQYNGERQGMSDTRFMEGGKYYYENNNSMQGYQNQLGLEGNNNIDEFQP
ncbi:protein E6-like [Neltuma alba]|uniref:protein E6-like n=1 Tax=Neltuma alba TaxID=207710 RepID=UPI0010A32D7F|nr:protein E6-like [Prosopis alba]